MLKVEIRPDWILRDAQGAPTALPALLALLADVSETGSISAAAKNSRMSYRHAWGLLQRFSEQFGTELVHKVRGQGTALTPLAEKLIWADRRIAARLTPLLDSLASELQQELARVLAGDAQRLRLTASHGFAVAALVAQLREQGLTVDIQYRSSTEAVAALARGSATWRASTCRSGSSNRPPPRSTVRGWTTSGMRSCTWHPARRACLSPPAIRRASPAWPTWRGATCAS